MGAPYRPLVELVTPSHPDWVQETVADRQGALALSRRVHPRDALQLILSRCTLPLCQAALAAVCEEDPVLSRLDEVLAALPPVPVSFLKEVFPLTWPALLALDEQGEPAASAGAAARFPDPECASAVARLWALEVLTVALVHRQQGATWQLGSDPTVGFRLGFYPREREEAAACAVLAPAVLLQEGEHPSPGAVWRDVCAACGWEARVAGLAVRAVQLLATQAGPLVAFLGRDRERCCALFLRRAWRFVGPHHQALLSDVTLPHMLVAIQEGLSSSSSSAQGWSSAGGGGSGTLMAQVVRKGGPAQSASKGTEALVRNASWVVPGLVHVFRNTHAAALLGCLDPEQGHWTGTLGRTRWQMLAAVTDAVWPPDAPDPSDMPFSELQRLWWDSSFGSLRALQVVLFSVLLVQLPMLPAIHRVIRCLHPSAEDPHPLANLSAEAVASGTLGLRHGVPLTMLPVVSCVGEEQPPPRRQQQPKKQPKRGGKGKSVEEAVLRLFEAPGDDRSAWASYSSTFTVSMWTLRLRLQSSFVPLQAVGARESEQQCKERTAAGLALAAAAMLPSMVKSSHKKKRTHQEHLQQEREDLETLSRMDSFLQEVLAAVGDRKRVRGLAESTASLSHLASLARLVWVEWLQRSFAKVKSLLGGATRPEYWVKGDLMGWVLGRAQARLVDRCQDLYAIPMAQRLMGGRLAEASVFLQGLQRLLVFPPEERDWIREETRREGVHGFRMGALWDRGLVNARELALLQEIMAVWRSMAPRAGDIIGACVDAMSLRGLCVTLVVFTALRNAEQVYTVPTAPGVRQKQERALRKSLNLHQDEPIPHTFRYLRVCRTCGHIKCTLCVARTPGKIVRPSHEPVPASSAVPRGLAARGGKSCGSNAKGDLVLPHPDIPMPKMRESSHFFTLFGPSLGIADLTERRMLRTRGPLSAMCFRGGAIDLRTLASGRHARLLCVSTKEPLLSGGSLLRCSARFAGTLDHVEALDAGDCRGLPVLLHEMRARHLACRTPAMRRLVEALDPDQPLWNAATGRLCWESEDVGDVPVSGDDLDFSLRMVLRGVQVLANGTCTSVEGGHPRGCEEVDMLGYILMPAFVAMCCGCGTFSTLCAASLVEGKEPWCHLCLDLRTRELFQGVKLGMEPFHASVEAEEARQQQRQEREAARGGSHMHEMAREREHKQQARERATRLVHQAEDMAGLRTRVGPPPVMLRHARVTTAAELVGRLLGAREPVRQDPMESAWVQCAQLGGRAASNRCVLCGKRTFRRIRRLVCAALGTKKTSSSCGLDVARAPAQEWLLRMHNTAEGVEESVGACVHCVDRSQLAQDILPPWRDFAGLLGGAESSGEREE